MDWTEHNTKAVEQTIEQFGKKLYGVIEQMEALQHLVGGLNISLNEIQQRVTVLYAMMANIRKE